MSHITEAGEHLTEDGAKRLADRIRDYWWARGHLIVAVWAEPVIGMLGYFQVRSNLVGALPPKVVT